MQDVIKHMPGVVAAVQAARSGSFSAAARVLNLTPAAVSKNVATLEAQLGVRLFNRTTRQLSPTEEGRRFLAEAQAALQRLHAAAALATEHLAPNGLVRVSCSVGFGRRFVLPHLPSFYAAHPQVQLELSLNDAQVDLVAEGFDVGVRGGSQPPEGMVARKIFDMQAVLVATPQYLAARGTPKRAADLAEHDLLRVRFANGRVNPWVFRDGQDGNQHTTFDGGRTVLWLSDPEVMLDAALLHLGIARMGYHHAADALASGALVQLLPKAHVGAGASMSVFYPHRSGLAPRVRVWVDHMLAVWALEPALR